MLTNEPIRRRTARLAGALAALALTASLTAAPATAADPPPIYLGFGDSYAAGIGGGAYEAGPAWIPALPCVQTAAAYSRMLGGENLACSGATTADVSAVVTAAAYNRTAAPYLANASVITVTVGGNDIEAGTAAAQCAASTATGFCKAALVNSLAVKLPQLPGKIKAMVAVIKKYAPRARIVLTGYPRLFTANASMPEEQKTTIRTLNSAADLLNGTIALSALANRVKYVSVTNQFTNHGIGSADPWIVGPPEPLCLPTINCALKGQPGDVFHPTATGYRYGYVPALAGLVP
ncbi:SGNH/GDSL hydrolase family protein [Arthrobacter sp. FW305-BF8]|uniref:SGNH/GDSL hydrolase family protein n=1 Tax=Arthrobacter sp. FW305-BF8 TaxID=2879617 RepID=UPI001F3D3DA2|nr:SGNH/GDSL hydrolase family protein [Arthrobacter sp. FW305-BF8]UKA53620.1 SGNH/GDSL hydrolase family protein [Arthrobacter sp. FW305-BF8]